MSSLPTGVWRHRDFLKLWIGQAGSQFGSLVGGFAYSLVAVITLHASPAQIAVLNGCGLVPGIIAGPWAGVLADLRSQRPVLIAVDLARALALASIPVAALVHTLSLFQLYVVAAIVSALTVVFDVTFRAYVPTLLERDALVTGNGALQATGAVAEAGGFAAAGLLIQRFTAPFAVAFDVASYIGSCTSLLCIRTGEEKRTHETGPVRHTWMRDLAEGMKAVRDVSVLRTLTLAACAAELAGQAVGVVIMLYFVRDLHLTPAAMGPVFGIGGVSAFIGALLCGRILRRWGLGRTVLGSILFNNIGLLAIVVATGPLPIVLGVVAVEQLTDAGRSVYEIAVTTAVQNHAPNGMIGRVFATYETLRSLAMVVGLIIAAILGQIFDLRQVLVLAFAANMLIPLCLALSPFRRLRALHPEGAAESMTA